MLYSSVLYNLLHNASSKSSYYQFNRIYSIVSSAMTVLSIMVATMIDLLGRIREVVSPLNCSIGFSFFE
ncbi:hypothetical protein L1987_02032 [Smallanthus sonchifolius]|uniref:Uncharacterized protein n=1 Tax=Smallanthus sonchifolius TaxID=185202 RepID=A0ACB9K6Q5_9ASTR|nr:hypothetical protein L1987_02032 [Smallanthus sonchifolius]